jgi:hypothetical protein
MALTITKLGDNGLDYAGLTPYGLFTLTGDSSYPAGGYAVASPASPYSVTGVPDAFGFGLHIAGIAQLATNNVATSLSLAYNLTTGKLQILGPGDASGTFLTLGTSSGTSTLSVATAANLVTITAPNTLVAGQFVVFQGSANGNIAKANGQLVQITAATSTTFSFTWAGIGGAVSSAADTGVTAQLVVTQTSNSVVIGGTATGIPSNVVIASNVGTWTVANTFVPGQLVELAGGTTSSAVNGYVVQVLTSSATQFTFNLNHANIATAAETTGSVIPLIVPGNAPIVTGLSASVTNSVLTSNVVSLSAVQDFPVSTLVMVQGLTNGAALNGYVGTIIATGLTNALFEYNFNHANISTGADAGAAAPLIVGGYPAIGAAEVPAGTNLTAYSWNAMVVAQR